MISRLLLAAALLFGGILVQRWSVQRSRTRRREKQVDIPRWEDEGGTDQQGDGAGTNTSDQQPTQRGS